MSARRTQQAHGVVADLVAPGQCVIDATVGNGHDTLFLASLVGGDGRVYGFDVQTAAIDVTRHRLASYAAIPTNPPLAEVTLIARSHAQMQAHVPTKWHGHVAAIMFNLGYLPGRDHALTTRWPSTLAAIDAGRRLLAPGGVISVLSYPGHPAGRHELDGILALIERAADPDSDPGDHLQWHEYDPRAAPDKAPRLFVARRQS